MLIMWGQTFNHRFKRVILPLPTRWLLALSISFEIVLAQRRSKLKRLMRSRHTRT